MNCDKCNAHMEDMQTGDHYCKELGILISRNAVKFHRKQEEIGFVEHIMNRFRRVQ